MKENNADQPNRSQRPEPAILVVKLGPRKGAFDVARARVCPSIRFE